MVDCFRKWLKKKKKYLYKYIFKILHKLLLSFRFTHHCRHFFFQLADYVGMYLRSSSTFNKLVDLKKNKYCFCFRFLHQNPIKSSRKGKHTRRSQAFFGMSIKSTRRSSCSFSKSSLPIESIDSSLIGLSLNDLLKSIFQ